MLVEGHSFDFAPFVEGYFLFANLPEGCCLLSFEDMYVSLPRGYPSLYVSGKLLITA